MKEEKTSSILYEMLAPYLRILAGGLALRVLATHFIGPWFGRRINDLMLSVLVALTGYTIAQIFEEMANGTLVTKRPTDSGYLWFWIRDLVVLSVALVLLTVLSITFVIPADNPVYISYLAVGVVMTFWFASGYSLRRREISNENYNQTTQNEERG